MRFVIYKNSILASICSLFGSAFVALAVVSMFNGELGILPGIGVIAAGLGLIMLGSFISERKAKKKQAKAAAAQKAASNGGYANAGHANPGYAQPRQAVYTNPAPAMQKNPVKTPLVLAGVLYLLAALFGAWALYLFKHYNYNFSLYGGPVLEYAACILLMIGCFVSLRSREVSALHLIGFIGLIIGNAEVALRYYRWYGFGGYSSASGVHNAMVFGPLFKIAAFFLMFLFAVFAMKNTKEKLGGAVRGLWFIPVPVLLLVNAKLISDYDSISKLQALIRAGRYMPRPDILEPLSMVVLTLAVLFTGYSLRCICKKGVPAVNPAGGVQPEPRYEAPRAAAYQNEPRYAQPEAPAQPVYREAPAAPAVDPDLEKKIQACKDLLDCGILSQAEYEQKIRELTRK